MATEKTTEQVRDEFLRHVRAVVRYWLRQDQTEAEKLEGLAFSILVALDGDTAALPKFIVAPDPHPDDKKFCISQDDDYYPENHQANVKADISGCLHELFVQRKPT